MDMLFNSWKILPKLQKEFPVPLCYSFSTRSVLAVNLFAVLEPPQKMIYLITFFFLWRFFFQPLSPFHWIPHHILRSGQKTLPAFNSDDKDGEGSCTDFEEHDIFNFEYFKCWTVQLTFEARTEATVTLRKTFSYKNYSVKVMRAILNEVTTDAASEMLLK